MKIKQNYSIYKRFLCFSISDHTELQNILFQKSFIEFRLGGVNIFERVLTVEVYFSTKERRFYEINRIGEPHHKVNYIEISIPFNNTFLKSLQWG